MGDRMEDPAESTPERATFGMPFPPLADSVVCALALDSAAISLLFKDFVVVIDRDSVPVLSKAFTTTLPLSGVTEATQIQVTASTRAEILEGTDAAITLSANSSSIATPIGAPTSDDLVPLLVVRPTAGGDCTITVELELTPDPAVRDHFAVLQVVEVEALVL